MVLAVVVIGKVDFDSVTVIGIDADSCSNNSNTQVYGNDQDFSSN